jgi:hypothetical protein
MLAVKISTTVRLPIALKNVSTGLPLLGVAYGSVSATVHKADGTSANLTVTSPDWAELTSGAFNGSGCYTLLLPTSATDTAGRLVVAVAVSGALDNPLSVIDVVANLESDTTTTLATLATAAALTAVGSNVTSIKTKTDNLPSDPADASDVAAAITAATSPLATSSALTTVGSNVTAIKAKTDNLPSDPADESLIEAAITAATSSLATSSALSTLSTAVADVKADTADLRLVASGRWKIDGSQMILYAADATTPLYTFDLLDENGAPTALTALVTERVPV